MDLGHLDSTKKVLETHEGKGMDSRNISNVCPSAYHMLKGTKSPVLQRSFGKVIIWGCASSFQFALVLYR